VVRDTGLLKEVSGLAGRPAFASAPVVIAACALSWVVPNRGREQPFFMIDVPIAITHIVLMAEELGIGTSLSFDFDEAALLRLIRAPKEYRAVSLIALGYAEKHASGPGEGPRDVVRII
jgi:nitroreductase